MYGVDWERSVREIKALLFITRDLSRLNGDLFNLYLFQQSVFIQQIVLTYRSAEICAGHVLSQILPKSAKTKRSNLLLSPIKINLV